MYLLIFRRQNRGKWGDRRTDRRQDRYTQEMDAMDNKDLTEEDKIKIKFGQIFGDVSPIIMLIDFVVRECSSS